MSNWDGKGRGGNKPPERSQFKPGQSGNPAGRKRGSVSDKKLFEKILLKRHKVVIDGKQTSLTALEILLHKLKRMAAEGHLSASKEWMMLRDWLQPDHQESGGVLVVPQGFETEEEVFEYARSLATKSVPKPSSPLDDDKDR